MQTTASPADRHTVGVARCEGYAKQANTAERCMHMHCMHVLIAMLVLDADETCIGIYVHNTLQDMHWTTRSVTLPRQASYPVEASCMQGGESNAAALSSCIVSCIVIITAACISQTSCARSIVHCVSAPQLPHQMSSSLPDDHILKRRATHLQIEAHGCSAHHGAA